MGNPFENPLKKPSVEFSADDSSSKEEKELEKEKQRTLSDAELLKGGAEYKINEQGKKVLDITKEQKIDLASEIISREEQEKREKDILGGEYIEINRGMKIRYANDNENAHKLSDSDYLDLIEYANNNKKVYNIADSSTVGIIDENGRILITPLGPDVINKLEDAGYKKGEVFVPWLINDKPDSQELSEKWDRMVEDSRKKSKENYNKNIHREIKNMAIQREIKEVEGEWMTLDGMEIINNPGEFSSEELDDLHYEGEGFDKKYYIPKIGESFNENKQTPMEVDDTDRVECVGIYGENNGVIALVDHEGKIRVAPWTQSRIEKLEKAGYKNTGMIVPLSNGDRPADRTLADKWERMIEDSEEETLQS